MWVGGAVSRLRAAVPDELRIISDNATTASHQRALHILQSHFHNTAIPSNFSQVSAFICCIFLENFEFASSFYVILPPCIQLVRL